MPEEPAISAPASGLEKAPIDAPPVPANKYALPRRSLRFMPTLAGEHPTSWTFPAFMDDPATPWVAELRRLYAEPIAFPASISPEAGLLLHALVRNIRPRTVVETGTFLGASTVWMASALDDGGALVAFDDFGPVRPGPWREAGLEGDRLTLVRDRLERAGLLSCVTLHKGDSATEIVRARADLRARGGVDLALIDGDHTVEGATRDFWAVEPVLNTGGYILLHDTFPEQCGEHRGPRHVVDRVNAIGQGLYESCELYLSPLNYGFGLLRRIG